MTYNNYLTDCLTFARETAKWAALDHYSVYTTNGSGWKESCDNNNGGIDVKWAFGTQRPSTTPMPSSSLYN